MASGSPMDLLVSRILDGTAPAQAKAAAARGALPLPRLDMARIFVHLLQDPDEGVRADASASLASMGDRDVLEILEAGECTPEVLEYFSRAAVEGGRVEFAARIAGHPAAPEEALNRLAGTDHAEILDRLLTNQERLLAMPGLMERLLENRALGAGHRSWIRETLERIRRQTESTASEAKTEPVEEEEDISVEEVARILNVDVGELLTASEISGGDEFQQEGVAPEIRGVYQKIMTLNTAQKAILAMKGGREERSILIRDTNRVVAIAVLKNPRIPDSEVEAIAAMRNVHDEVLRNIGANREWVKSYAVALALVRNPRTPPGISTNFISRLNSKDLKFLSKDKNVPEIIRRMAKKTSDLREQRSRVSFKKH